MHLRMFCRNWNVSRIVSDSCRFIVLQVEGEPSADIAERNGGDAVLSDLARGRGNAEKERDGQHDDRARWHSAQHGSGDGPLTAHALVYLPSTLSWPPRSGCGGGERARRPHATLALFSSSGALIGQNDDGAPGTVPVDPATGRAWDTFLQLSLTPGDYAVSVMQYDNFANGPNPANGFQRDGQLNFTSGFGCSNHIFCDVSGSNRDSHWAFDVLNVEGRYAKCQCPAPSSVPACPA